MEMINVVTVTVADTAWKHTWCKYCTEFRCCL